ncbi:hypothetical protein FKN01_29615 [Streptomyces sp. 130]|uniref:hypothetical protein n=1 Tax=Streptomyces sp. 130 TaxID=2591006 RepID=UPI00117EB0BF|nr:hypothetical protein [Streptomyces sp. 130]TRV72552.1 hypothetical protein FKN01_29615 [Streptomyces sp. 130]
MPLLRRRREADTQAPPRAIAAAAMPMSGPGVLRASKARKQTTNSDWQREGWYYFDVIGELRGPLVWIANAVSQADVHATELDPETGKPTGPSDNPTAKAVAAQVLGGPARRGGLLRVLSLCWQVPGEAWVIVKPTPARRGQTQPDEWIVLPPSKVKAKGSGADARWEYTDPMTGVDMALEPAARLFRVWCPHPADYIQADSAVRPALPICREVEKASQNIAGRLDSRLASAGLLALADDLDFPKGEHETTAMAFMDELLSAAETGIQQPGTAAAVVPLVFNAPGELIANGGAAAFIDTATEFVSSVVDLRNDALARLAATLDMPRDVAAGTQGESNHWSAWQVEESTYKIFIEPLLKEIGDAITAEWFRPALMAAGMTEEQAAAYEVGWDTTAIVARPDDTENLRDLHDRLLISDEYMLAENGVPEDARPDDAEYTKRLLESMVKAAPTLLSDPNVAQALGLEITVAPAATGVSGEVTGGELEPSSPELEQRALPATQDEEPDPASVPDGLVAAAELLVFDALSRAGGRLITRENRGQFTATPKHELHTVIAAADINALMEGSFQFVDGVAEAFGMSPDFLNQRLRDYTRRLIATGKPHDRARLRMFL